MRPHLPIFAIFFALASAQNGDEPRRNMGGSEPRFFGDMVRNFGSGMTETGKIASVLGADLLDGLKSVSTINIYALLSKVVFIH